MIDPKEALLGGAIILEQVLGPKGFEFRFCNEGRGSGGHFAWGEFVRGERRLELHFRRSLGLVYYHIGDHCASHGAYMKELGVREQCKYPDFSDDPMAGFRNLAQDLTLALDFLDGSGFFLRKAAAKDSAGWADRNAEMEAGYVGDTAALERMHALFWQGRYGEVLALAHEISFPERMTETQKRIVAIARERA